MKRSMLMVWLAALLFAFAGVGCGSGGSSDGDAGSDGDAAVDGDQTQDGDTAADGDGVSDGDAAVDGDQTVDGDVLVDGDQPCTQRLAPDQASIDFGTVAVGGAGQVDLTLRNEREAGPGCPVTVDGLSMAPNTSAAFSVSPPVLPAVLGSGQPLTVRVSCRPAEWGVMTGTLRVGVDGAVNSPQLDIGLRCEAPIPADGDTGPDGDTGTDGDTAVDGDTGCRPGSEGCGCRVANPRCNQGLVCDNGICVPAGTDGDTGPDGDGEPDGDGTATGCDAVGEGFNQNFLVRGVARSFMLGLPSGAGGGGGPYAVVFNWHGFGDTAQNYHQLLSWEVNNTRMPFILVTPEKDPSTFGFDWDFLRMDGNNKEVALFDAILGCLRERWPIDDDRVYSTGFSAGSIMTDGLGVTRGDVLAASLTFSGAYFSNPDNVAALGIGSGMVTWVPLSTANHFVQAFLHGGPTDNYNLSIVTLQFNQMAINDAAYLNGLGHDVVLCDHSQAHPEYTAAMDGHTVPPECQTGMIVDFFADHPRGTTESPYRQTAMPQSFPAYCSFLPHP